jgi:hypothetical protein
MPPDGAMVSLAPRLKPGVGRTVLPMDSKPISLEALQVLINRELVACSDELRMFFAGVAFPPAKWRQSQWGDAGGGFWAVAAHNGLVLWYNDIEDGFNISRFAKWGEIPDDEYWCNGDPLQYALPRLAAADGLNCGPPWPLSR